MSIESLSAPRLAASSLEGLAPSARKPLFRKILVPIDFSSASLKALGYALALGAPAHSEVQMAYVLEPASRFLGIDVPPTAVRDDDVVASCEHDLHCIADENRTPDVRLVTSVTVGNPAREVIDLACALPADLIVLSTHGRTGVKHLLLGSVAERIVREAPCPVLVVRKYERDFARSAGAHQQLLHLRKILVPTDFSAPAEAALRQAIQFAEDYGGQITLLYALPFAYLPGERELTEYKEDAGVLRRRAEAQAALERQANEQIPAALRGSTFITTGAPMEQILDFAACEGFDLIVCGTHGRTGGRHFLRGSLAEGMVRRAVCPVMVVSSEPARSKASGSTNLEQYEKN